ncbi:MAG TPA: TMEM175 family protein [Anaeromyxobacteraceae bacterium]|nr:TMEM175 family protein [Anaeromyxobacteraceae bacterium]
MRHEQSPRDISPNRMDAFTDGAFSIVATLLVLEVRVPQIREGHSQVESWRASLASPRLSSPSRLSFLTIAIYWLNHELVSQFVPRYDRRSRYWNLLLLFCICLISFVIRFIAEYPLEPVSVMSYAVVMPACALASDGTFRYVAFRSDPMDGSVDESSGGAARAPPAARRSCTRSPSSRRS